MNDTLIRVNLFKIYFSDYFSSLLKASAVVGKKTWRAHNFNIFGLFSNIGNFVNSETRYGMLPNDPPPLVTSRNI